MDLQIAGQGDTLGHQDTIEMIITQYFASNFKMTFRHMRFTLVVPPRLQILIMEAIPGLSRFVCIPRLLFNPSAEGRNMDLE